MKTNTKSFNLGLRIQELRKHKNLSQEQLALRSNITPTYLGLIERDLKNPTFKVVEQICDALDISLTDFFSENSSNTLNKSDIHSIQILSQIENCTKEEKKLILRIIKDIIRYKRI